MSIHQQATIPADPRRVYQVLADAEALSALSGMSGKAAQAEGEAFAAFDGNVTGRQIELVPGTRIVQAWRFPRWEPGQHSLVTFTVTAADGGTRLTIDQHGEPDDWHDHIAANWPTFYLTPLTEHFAASLTLRTAGAAVPPPREGGCGVMAETDLLQAARSGDEAAFAGLVAPYRRELHVHCYRMLGSFDDAEDAVQETLLAAWRGLASFQGRASVRTWLYKVATNACLNLIRTASRRPQMADQLPASAPAPTGTTEVTWLQPYPDLLLDELPDPASAPHARIEQVEAVSLAFVTALQLLSPRARAVLVLRDVLGFSAAETAEALGSTPQAVAMTLSRARAALREHAPARATTRSTASTAGEARLVRLLTEALTAHDVDAVVGLLAEDVRIAMPPLPAVWQGRDRAAAFLAEVAFRLVPRARFVQTRANGQPALAVYMHDAAGGLWRAGGLLVLTLDGEQITGLTRFETATMRPFGLPAILPGDQSDD